MRRSTGAVRRLATVALVSLTGCASLGRSSPPLEQYVLGATPAPAAAAAAAPEVAGMRIGLRRIDIATYLAAPAIVVRRGANQLVVSDFHRWGEDLGSGVGRLVARRLLEAGAAAADNAPWTVRTEHDYLVQLHLTRFEGVVDSAATEGGAHVAATWEILRPSDGAVLARGHAEYTPRGWKPDDYAALVVLLEQGLQQATGELLRCLAQVRAAAAPSSAAGAADVLTCGVRGGT